MFKKALVYILPVLARAFLIVLEREIRTKLYGPPPATYAPRRTPNGPWADYSATSQARTSPKKDRTILKPGFRPTITWSNDIFVVDGLMASEADEIMSHLRTFVDQYSYVCVADIYELTGLSERVTYRDNQVGWRDLDSVRKIQRTSRDGFRLVFTSPQTIE